MTTASTGKMLLVGIDFSQGCERALLRAVTLAEQCQGQLELVHVYEWECCGEPIDARANLPDGVSSAPWSAVNEQARTARARLGQLCADFVADRVPAEIRVLIGDPAAGLLKTAEQVHASCIVLGELGRSALPRGPVGATAERVCESSAVPVRLVPWAKWAQSRQGQHGQGAHEVSRADYPDSARLS